jgi:tRNA(fMet)-specific endonuclease VapC
VIYLLDTNACIQFLNKRLSSVTQKITQAPAEHLCLCSPVQMELYYGAYRSSQSERNLAKLVQFFAQFRVLSFDSEAALVMGKIRAQLATKGTPIGPYDLQIAAIAIVNHLILVTHNTREFQRVAGLPLEDWEV